MIPLSPLTGTAPASHFVTALVVTAKALVGLLYLTFACCACWMGANASASQRYDESSVAPRVRDGAE